MQGHLFFIYNIELFNARCRFS